MNAQETIARQMRRERQRSHQPSKVLEALLSFGIGEGALAGQLGVVPSVISHWKSGERPVPEDRQQQLYELLGEFISAKQQTVRLLKRQRRWDPTMRRIVNDRFRRAQAVYDARPERFKSDQDAA